MRIILSVLLIVALAGLTGCSISASSGSISDSISSPFKSSSKSSGSSDDDDSKPEAPADTAGYEADVSQLARTFAKTGGDIDGFRTAVSKLAKERGVTNWEADSKTNRAIGRGVGTAGMQEDAFVTFSKQLYGSDLSKQNDLRKGYQETAPSMSQPAPQAQPESKPSEESKPAAE
jgi:hypothetical protein